MNRPRPKLSAPDWAILAIAAACGISAVASSDLEFTAFRRWMAGQDGGPSVPTGPPWSFGRVEPVISRAVQDLKAFLYAIQPGLFLVAYRPRPGTRRLRRGPGQVALAIGAALILYIMVWFGFFTYGPETWTGFRAGYPANYPATFWLQLPTGSIAYATIAAWIYLAAIGGWRDLRRPFERLGLCLGGAWILASMVTWGLGLRNDV